MPLHVLSLQYCSHPRAAAKAQRNQSYRSHHLGKPFGLADLQSRNRGLPLSISRAAKALQAALRDMGRAGAA